jgi:hypothetical protein
MYLRLIYYLYEELKAITYLFCSLNLIASAIAKDTIGMIASILVGCMVIAIGNNIRLISQRMIYKFPVWEDELL